MNRFILVLHCPPWSHQSVATACQFAQAAIDRGNSITAVFLYQDAVLNGSNNLDIPSDELNGQSQLVNLNSQHNIPLLMCVTAAEKRGVNADALHPSFTLSGLAEFAELTTESDKMVQFK
ncbi:sulfurtransferase complex subunit TusD [Psychrosphaera algicola]|uniref:Sulfurtransferase complex subunit TusD n=1 Tax=Psychrosphaera algicola TaxID=3023714 RepID=A0ABT5FJV8_9GAMM|nr:sulfurtransferase complex subunit TusD [Psychrosphaera sp. G1-22]MDC2891480.1 sulfurtransferase complex subunit TusD [Psychrosphaera sp. G1-22]